MPQDQRTRQGYLLRADISGYTAFLTGTELEHAHGIVNELTTLIGDRLAPPTDEAQVPEHAADLSQGFLRSAERGKSVMEEDAAAGQ